MSAPGEPSLHAVAVGVDAERVDELHRAGAIQLVDVREGYEWDAGRIGGARHLELARVAAEAATLDSARPVVFYCRVGARSAMAARAFRRAGFEAYSMDGGLEAWTARELPLEPRGGHVAEH
jgi:hydroxyacylglutathione hydrolase/adenylyltransferase/sulfurtransferase